jgi:hypothetical protein
VSEQVYWVGNNDTVCCGDVVARQLAPVEQVVVRFDRSLKLLSKSNAWEQWFATPQEPVAAAIRKASKEMTIAGERVVKLSAIKFDAAQPQKASE